jgi:hypothetical protein
MNSSGNTTAFMPSTAPEVRQPEVQQEFLRADQCAGYIDKITEELEGKLVAVLATRKQLGGNEQSGNPEPVRVPLAQNLYELGSRLERIRERLDSILNRLEV